MVGRSLAFGLGVGLSWFAADNIGTFVFALVYAFTGADFWRNITGFFLGPLLNYLPALLVPAQQVVLSGSHGPVRAADTIGASPLAQVDTTQALLVIAGYCVVFVAVAVFLTRRRDVLE